VCEIPDLTRPVGVVELLTKKPWLLPNLHLGRIPHEAAS
jgi:hypothetical protein